MTIGILTLHFLLPGCTSLKEKRSHIKPLLARLHREFNISAAEVDRNDAWQESVIACALVSNEKAFTQRVLEKIVTYSEEHFPDLELLEHHVELL